MRRLIMSAAVVLLAASCTSSNGSEGTSSPHQITSSQHQSSNNGSDQSLALPPGFTGGCKQGITLYVQHQFAASADNGSYGTTVRDTLEGKPHNAGLSGNETLISTGWFKTGTAAYPYNPEGVRGEVWYFIPKLPISGKPAWVSDAGVRQVPTTEAPNNDNRYFKPEVETPQKPAECQLSK